ncbi:MAG: arsenite methyltransferase [Rhodothermales bacterium]|nr:arsenite methyltransferase [Rhodothermales bacterium]
MITTIEIEKEDVACCGDDCCSDTSEAESLETAQESDIKIAVKENYGRIADAAATGAGCGCGCGDSKSIAPTKYNQMDGYAIDADLGLGCGLPNQFAELQDGEFVLDLGSGAGLDAFISRKAVGEAGSVVGVDMTPSMIELANKNKAKLGYSNVDFRLGELEDLPVETNVVDVAISNCVFNLVPDKRKAFAELFRVLKTGGRFSISDIVYSGELPQSVRDSVNLYVGCVAGAVSLETYVNMLLETGFYNIAIRSISTIQLDGFTATDDDEKAVAEFLESGGRVLSITVTGDRA